MDTPAEKGCVAVTVPPDPHSKSLDPPPPYYPGVPTYAGLPAAPQGQPSYPEGRSQDHVQLVLPAAPPPNDYVLWSLFNAMFCNFYCLGFAALAFSVKSRDQLVMGNIPAARRYGSSAQRLNLAALSVTIISIAFFIFGCYKNRLF